MSNSQLSVAASAAEQSKFSTLDPQRAHGCFITKGKKKRVAVGANTNRSRNRINENDIYHTCSTHAEVSAVKSLMRQCCRKQDHAKVA